MVVLILGVALAFAAENGPVVTLTPGRAGDPVPVVTAEVSGLAPGDLDALERDPHTHRAALTVFTVDDPKAQDLAPGDRPTLLGKTEFDRAAGVLRFRGRFPAEPGMHYRAVFRLPGGGRGPIGVTRSVPYASAEGPETRVVQVAPGADVVPENLLKFYVEFSAPMGRGEAYDRVRLLDAAGKPLGLPFLELGEELWDPRGVRLTLLFDPGRIKTGLKPREELGPVLEAGKSYTLVVDRRWCDGSGRPLAADFRKTFRVGPPDVTPPDPKTWKLDLPAAGTRDPLVVRFPEPLDRAMLGRLLWVNDGPGKPLAGWGAVGPGETSWSFTPDQPWEARGYALKIGRDLEDLAGNSPGRPFEVDVFRPSDPRPGGEVMTVPFDPGGVGR